MSMTQAYELLPTRPPAKAPAAAWEGSGTASEARSPLNKKLRFFKAYVTGRPVWVTWQVTYNCKYACSFCDYWQNDFKPEEENSLEDFRIGSKKLAEFGSLLVSLAGGEPLLRPDLHQIIAILAEDHFPYFTTSGSGMTLKRARQLWEAGLWGATISIDYADPERHAKSRGIKYAFERAITAIEQLLSTRTDPKIQRVQIMSVLTDDNLNEMPKLAELAERLGVWWRVQPYSAMKTGDQSQRHLHGAPEVLLDLKRRYPRTFHSNAVYLEKFDEAANGGISGCIAGKSMFNIDNNMVVSKCVEFNSSEPLGNLRTDSMRDVLAALRTAHRNNTCTDCWYSCRGEVEVLYHPRGFADRITSLLWQDSMQPGASPEVFTELSRRGHKAQDPGAMAALATPPPFVAPDSLPLKLRITPDSACLPMTESFATASAIGAKEETQ
ncbi:MAG TPA: radical SAM protein [Candidatus Udaeobacter sp.]|nr:radical SAM protein [Candidatus Udaeobacter sp.]